MLLYVGTVLISFSILVFVAFNWQTFTNGVKCGLLLAFTGAFYLGGIVFYKTDMFRSAGVTFITIASIVFGLMGIGLWRFGLNGNVGFNFKTYWILYSILLLFVYAFTLYRTQLTRFHYFAVAAFYSLTVTTGLRINDHIKKQLIFILGINLVFYFCSGLFISRLGIR